ncbi:hypothetical protein HDU67_006080, partial [Dinochytrium kinnereticum]
MLNPPSSSSPAPSSAETALHAPPPTASATARDGLRTTSTSDSLGRTRDDSAVGLDSGGLDQHQQMGHTVRKSFSRSSMTFTALIRRSVGSAGERSVGSGERASTGALDDPGKPPADSLVPNKAEVDAGPSKFQGATHPPHEHRAFRRSRAKREPAVIPSTPCESPIPVNQPSIPPMNLSLPRISIESLYRHGKHVLRRDASRSGGDAGAYHVSDRSLSRRPRSSMSSDVSHLHSFTWSMGRRDRRRVREKGTPEPAQQSEDQSDDQTIRGPPSPIPPHEGSEDDFSASLSPAEFQQIVAALRAPNFSNDSSIETLRRLRRSIMGDSLAGSTATLQSHVTEERRADDECTSERDGDVPVVNSWEGEQGAPGHEESSVQQLEHSKKSFIPQKSTDYDTLTPTDLSPETPPRRTSVMIEVDTNNKETTSSPSQSRNRRRARAPSPQVSLSLSLSTPSPHLVNRILHEFLSTERTYVHELSSLFALYIRPFVKEARGWSRLDGVLMKTSASDMNVASDSASISYFASLLRDGNITGKKEPEEDITSMREIPAPFRRVILAVFGNVVEILGLHACLVLPALKDALSSLFPDGSSFGTLPARARRAESNHGTLGSQHAVRRDEEGRSQRQPDVRQGETAEPGPPSVKAPHPTDDLYNPHCDVDSLAAKRDRTAETGSVASGVLTANFASYTGTPTISTVHCCFCGADEDHSDIADECYLKVASEFEWMSRYPASGRTLVGLRGLEEGSVPSAEEGKRSLSGATDSSTYPAETQVANIFSNICETSEKAGLHCYREFLSGLDRSLQLVTEIETLANVRHASPHEPASSRPYSQTSRNDSLSSNAPYCPAPHTSACSIPSCNFCGAGNKGGTQERIRALRLSERFLSESAGKLPMKPSIIPPAGNFYSEEDEEKTATQSAGIQGLDQQVKSPAEGLERVLRPSSPYAESPIATPSSDLYDLATRPPRRLNKKGSFTFMLKRKSNDGVTPTGSNGRESSQNPSRFSKTSWPFRGAKGIYRSSSQGPASDREEKGSPTSPESIPSISGGRVKAGKRHSFDPRLLFGSRTSSSQREESEHVESIRQVAAFSGGERRGRRRRRRARGAPVSRDGRESPAVGGRAVDEGMEEPVRAGLTSFISSSLATDSIALGELVRIISRVAEDPRRKQIGLGAYLVLPLQRLTRASSNVFHVNRYGILLDRLASALAPDHPSRTSVERAAHGVRAIIEICNGARSPASGNTAPPSISTQGKARQRLGLRPTCISMEDLRSPSSQQKWMRARGAVDAMVDKAPASSPIRQPTPSTQTPVDLGTLSDKPADPVTLEYLKPPDAKDVLEVSKTAEGVMVEVAANDKTRLKIGKTVPEVEETGGPQ